MLFHLVHITQVYFSEDQDRGSQVKGCTTTEKQYGDSNQALVTPCYYQWG